MKLFVALLGFILISAHAQTPTLTGAVTTAVNALTNNPEPIVACDDNPNVSRLAQVLSEKVETKAARCPADVGPGQYRLMQRRGGYQSGNFLFKNLGNNQYRAVLNIDFKSSTPNLAASMRARAINCLKDMSPYLLGEGKQLDVQILSPKEVKDLPRDQRPAPYRVDVSPQNKHYRGNAAFYGSNFQCATIGHEVLHLLGLCDEYYEGFKDDSEQNGSGKYIDWRCRAVTSEPSYMRNMLYAFQSSIPQTTRCECNDECQKIMRHSPEARRLYMGMNGEDYLNTEMSVMDNHIIGFDANKNPIRRQICKFVSTPGLQVGTLPAKNFELQSESGNHFVFRSYEAHIMTERVSKTDHIWFGVQTYDCTCPEGESNSYCRRIMEQMKQRTNEYQPRVVCPQGTKALDYGPSIGHQNVSDPLQCEGDRCTLVMTSPGNGKPLLLPQQFERIAAGNCRGGKASAYEKCEVFATKGGNANECSAPPECNDDRFFLHGESSAPVTTSAQ